MSDAAPKLSEAFDLIERGELATARQILTEIQDDNVSNPDYWWVYAHSIEDPEEGRKALNRVLELRPDYPGAQKLLHDIDGQVTTERHPIRSLKTSTTAPTTDDAPLDFGDDLDLAFEEFGLEDDFESVEDDTRSGQGRIVIGAIVVALMFIIIAVAAVLLSNTGGGTPTQVAANPTQEATSTPEISTAVDSAANNTATATATSSLSGTGGGTPTQVAANPTQEATSTPEISTAVSATATTQPTIAATATLDIPPTPTTEVASSNADDSDDPFASIYPLLRNFDVPNEGITTQSTDLGDTLVVTTCATPGPAASTAISGIAQVISEQSDTLDPNIRAIGFSVNDCADNTVIRLIGVPISIVRAFGSNELSLDDFQTLLRPIG